MTSNFASWEMVQWECFVLVIEPKNHIEALTNDLWIIAMEEELEQFVRNKVWELVPRPTAINVIGTKWIFENKIDEKGLLAETKQDWWHKGIHKSKELILRRHLHQ